MKILMKNYSDKYFGLFLLVILVLLFSGCAEAIEIQYDNSIEQVGFWSGLLHGLIAPISFVISLFNDSVAIYAVNNNGGWYNLGYLLGLSVSVGGGSRASKRKS
jgi:hypothetical protein